MTARARAARAPPRSTRARRRRGPTQRAAAAGVPFAVKNLFDIAGVTTLAGAKIERAPAGRGGCDAGRRLKSSRRGARRRAQHGRVRLRLHHREHALRRQPATRTTCAHRRRLVGRLGRRSRRRPGAADARLGHQRLDPRAGFAVRHLRPEADLRPAAAPAAIPFVPASITSGRSRATARDLALAYDAHAGPRSPTTRLARAAVEPTADALGTARDGLRIAVLGGYSPTRRARSARRGRAGRRRAAARGARVELPEVEAARAAAFLITNAEGARAAPARPAQAAPRTSNRCRATASSPAR